VGVGARSQPRGTGKKRPPEKGSFSKWVGFAQLTKKKKWLKKKRGRGETKTSTNPTNHQKKRYRRQSPNHKTNP